MARTTFTGPVDSENGFEEVYIDPVTGTRTITGVVTTVPGVPVGSDPSLVVGAGDSALDFIPSSTSPTVTSAAVVPYNATNKTTTDNTIDLGTPAARFKNLYSGDIYLADDAGIYFGTAPTPPTPPAVGPQSNYLNDYEEGTWTPILNGSISGDQPSGAQNIGRYTKFGNLVTVTGTLDWSGGSAATGDIAITGLPYPVNAPIEAGQAYRSSGSLGGAVGVTMPTSFQNGLSLLADPGQTAVSIITRSTTGFSKRPTIAAVGTIYGMSMTYETTS